MKEAMFLCTAIAVLGALLRLFAETAGGKTAEKRTRHLSPHRAAIDKIKGKESAARRTDR